MLAVAVVHCHSYAGCTYAGAQLQFIPEYLWRFRLGQPGYQAIKSSKKAGWVMTQTGTSDNTRNSIDLVASTEPLARCVCVCCGSAKIRNHQSLSVTLIGD